MLIKRLLFKRILILLQNSICGITNAYSYGRKATPQNGRGYLLLCPFQRKRVQIFSGVQHFVLHQKTYVTNANYEQKRSSSITPEKKRPSILRCDYSAMKIWYVTCGIKVKNTVTIAWTLRIYPLVPANFDRCMQETKLVKNIYSYVVRNSSFPR